MNPTRYLAVDDNGIITAIYRPTGRFARGACTLSEKAADEWFDDPSKFDHLLIPGPDIETPAELEKRGCKVFIWGDAAIRPVPGAGRFVVAFKKQDGTGYTVPAKFTHGSKDLFSPTIEGLVILGAKTYGRRVDARRALSQRRK